MQPEKCYYTKTKTEYLGHIQKSSMESNPQCKGEDSSGVATLSLNQHKNIKVFLNSIGIVYPRPEDNDKTFN